MDKLLEVRGLRTYFHTDRGLFRAVDGIDFSVERGQTVGLVGESGCGKSVTSLSVMGLVASPPGQVEAEADPVRRPRRARPLRRRAPPAARRQDVDDLPGADDLAEPGPHDRPADRRGDPGAHPTMSPQAAKKRAIEMLELVRIPSAGASGSTIIRTACRAACASAS